VVAEVRFIPGQFNLLRFINKTIIRKPLHRSIKAVYLHTYEMYQGTIFKVKEL